MRVSGWDVLTESSLPLYCKRCTPFGLFLDNLEYLSRHSNIGIKHMVIVMLKLDEDVMAAILVLPACALEWVTLHSYYSSAFGFSEGL